MALQRLTMHANFVPGQRNGAQRHALFTATGAIA